MRPWICLLMVWPLLAEARGRGDDGRPDGSRPGVALTLGLNAGAMVVRGNEYVGDQDGFGLVGGWIGATVHPRPDRASLFVSMGLEVNGVLAPDDDRLVTMEFVPEVRGGLALLNKPFWEFLPQMELYVLSGFRLPNQVRGSALRLGAGISIPAFGVAQFESFGRSYPPIIPWMFEIIYDVSDVPETSFRVGYHF